MELENIPFYSVSYDSKFVENILLKYVTPTRVEFQKSS